MLFFARMKRISLIALLAVLVSCSTNANRPAPPHPVTPDAYAVRAAVQHTFDGLAVHDSTMPKVWKDQCEKAKTNTDPRSLRYGKLLPSFKKTVKHSTT